MPGILDLVDAVNLIARVETVVGALIHNTASIAASEWRGSSPKRT